MRKIMKHSKDKVYVPSERDYGGEYLNECVACRQMFMADEKKTFCKLCTPEGKTKKDNKIIVELTEAERRLVIKLIRKHEMAMSLGVKGLTTLYDLEKKFKKEK